MADDETFIKLLDAMKHAAAVLRDSDLPFALAGGLAIYARGGPATEHDVDFILREEDAERALEALARAGFRTERPPEGWLFKAWDGDVLVDVIFQPRGLEMTDEVFARGETREVMAISVNLMALEDVFATKLLAFDEHNCDYSEVLLRARALREQIDWDQLRDRVEDWPFARAFFVLAEGLGIVQDETVSVESDDRGRGHVRIVDP
jgi:hypothetical protein